MNNDVKYLTIGLIIILFVRLLTFIQTIVLDNQVYPTIIINTIILGLIIGSLILILKKYNKKARQSYLLIASVSVIGIVTSFVTGNLVFVSQFVITGVLFAILYKQEKVQSYVSKKIKNSDL